MPEQLRPFFESASGALRDPQSWLGIDAFEAPERLPWLLLLVLLALGLAFRRKEPGVPWPGMTEAARAGARRLEFTPGLALLLRAAALLCLGVVLARPVKLFEPPPEPGRGLDLILVLDTSASMRALDAGAAPRQSDPFDPRDALRGASSADAASATNPYRTRLELAKQVVSRFAEHRVSEGDRVGLVVFGSTAFTLCPLTSDGELLSAALRRVEVGVAGEATALGDALALAVKRAPKSDSAAGRVVVLLTDGRSNAGSIPIEIASALAAGDKLRVHTVGIGTGGEEVAVAMRGARGESRLRFERHDTDPETLERIAQTTGGRYFAATRSSDLHAVYDAIDSFERIDRPLPPQIRQTLHAEPLLATAGAMLLLEITIAGIVRRRVP